MTIMIVVVVVMGFQLHWIILTRRCLALIVQLLYKASYFFSFQYNDEQWPNRTHGMHPGGPP